MRSCVTNSTIILLFILIMSCELPDTAEPVNLEAVETVDENSSDLIPEEEGANWFLRDISGTAEDSTLTYFTVDRYSINSLELSFEQYKSSDEDANRFDFIFRYYFLVDISMQDNKYNANITGIKTGRYNSYIEPGNADFTTMLEDAGLEDFQLNYNKTDSTIQIQTDTNITYSLHPSYRYRQTSAESLEHNGKIRNGEYTESFYYSPMGDEFHLYAADYFTYINDEGGTTTLSSSFDTYGERFQDSSAFQCEITQFSNRAYPRAFYSDSYISNKFGDFINDLGFSQFSEQSAAKDITLVFDVIGAEGSSYTLRRSPVGAR